jgi:hypothetical protein
MFGLGFLADVYKPSDLMAEFRSIPVDCDGTEVSVRVTRYRNLKHVGKASGTENAVAVMSGLNTVSKGAAGRDCTGPGKNPWLDVFTGKGSPENIGVALSTLYRYRREFVQRYEKTPQYPMLRSCAEMLAKKEGDPGAMMREACYRYIGLDCSGFAGRYIENVNPKWGGPNSIIPLMPNGRTRRTKLAEIAVGDLLVWTEPNHVAVIDARVGPDQFRVSQSTGPGLIQTLCKLVPSRNARGKFDYLHSSLPDEPTWDRANDGAGGRPALIVSLAPAGQTFP